MTDHEDIDARLRAAWRDRDEDDHRLAPAPPDLWDDIRHAVASDPSASDATATTPTRRRRRWPMYAVAAAAGLLVAVAVGGLIQGGADPAVTAEAELTTQDLDVPSGPTGQARLVEDDGDVRLDVDVDGIPEPDDGVVLEVWLLDPEGGGLQSLGLIEGSNQLLLPPSVDVSRYSTVDVSREPTDGDPTHSGDSVLRGRLEPT